MTPAQQRDVLDKTYRLLTDFCGKPPRGTVAPWWETSAEGTDLLLRYGIEYDHSMAHHDCQMYWLRTGDTWTKIDYTKKAKDWMKPLVKGQETGLVEIPGSWYIDDLPPMMFIKNSPNSHGWTNPRDIEDIWKVDFSCFPLPPFRFSTGGGNLDQYLTPCLCRTISTISTVNTMSSSSL